MSALTSFWRHLCGFSGGRATPPVNRGRYFRGTRLCLETLETRLTPAVHNTFKTAIPLDFGANNQAQVAGMLSDPNQVDMYAIQLNAGDDVVVDVRSSTLGSPAVYVRIFDTDGFTVAHQASSGSLDTAVAFDVAATGTYHVGISSLGNDNYDPLLPLGDSGGLSTGAYTLILARSSQVLPYETLPVGNYPTAVAVGDLNHDGNLDLVTANTFDNTVSVLLGRGDGSFQPALTYPVAAGPTFLALADLNHDGNLDIITVSQDFSTIVGTSTVSVLLGRGDGTFQPAVSTALGNLAVSMAVGDLNHDGNLDLVIANMVHQTVSVLMGRGDGTFQPAVSTAVGYYPGALALADLNHDGNLDLVVTNSSDEGIVSVLLGRGNGTFLPPVSYAVGGDPTSVAVGDFNHDGNLDLVVANDGPLDPVTEMFDASTVSVLLGRGDGTFGPAVSYAVGNEPQSVAVGDFNNDGSLDIVTANSLDSTVSVLLGRGDGTFLAAAAYAVGYSPNAVAVGDFRRDGNLDIVTANTENTVSVLLAQAGGKFQGASSEVFVHPNPILLFPVINANDSSHASATVLPHDSPYITASGASQYFRTAGTNLFFSTLPTGTAPMLALGATFTEGLASLPSEAALLAQTDPFTGFGDQRTALQALSQDNSPDSYLTYRGTPLSLSIVDVAASAAVAQGTNLPAGDLLLVATLQVGRLTESLAITRTEAAPDERTYAVFLPPSPVPGRVIGEVVADLELGRPLPPDEAPWESFPLGATEALRQRLEFQRARDRVDYALQGLHEGFDRLQDWLSRPGTPGPVSQDDSPLPAPAALIATVFAMGLALHTPEENQRSDNLIP